MVNSPDRPSFPFSANARKNQSRPVQGAVTDVTSDAQAVARRTGLPVDQTLLADLKGQPPTEPRNAPPVKSSAQPSLKPATPTKK